MSETPSPRIVIVGAGPAGIRAAATLVEAGLHPMVIDEGNRAGGQIYRRPPAGFVRTPEQLYASEATKARALHALFDRLAEEGRLTHCALSSVIAMHEGRLHLLGEGGVEVIGYDRLILATGASDRVAPIPGWQNAGVYSLGAAQIALKAQGVALGRRIVLIGSGPLLTLVGAQLLKAGANVAAVLDTSPWRQQMRGFWNLAARPIVALRGLVLRARLGGRYHAGVTLERIEADASGVAALRWRDAGGRERLTPCDMIGMGWHLRAETHLADLAGCAFTYDEQWRQWLPKTDEMGRAGNGVYIAGDGVRLLGADGAEIAGRLAAAACLSDLGRPAPSANGDLRKLARLERFARGLATAFPWPEAMARALPDEAIVCRCENVTAGAVRESVECGGGEANRVKSLSRVGMGRCQGRYCQLAAADLVAGRAGCTAGAVGRFRGQAPVRPAPVGAIIRER
ncbi:MULTISPECIES: FAD/NAD(P)-binding oxidoreductase [unclassified Mesorhizobium]|uniref:FAD/NAD(P)-dependent oxidoreductase n=1 Tax=unclassified Mesorhizobium TaxID=325217 RepID=UPI000FCCE0A0|nr:MULTISPECIES: FAD/NAD(P)-binding oxidoreductase [unclassified Mesorhizobium]TGP20129.1 NAD(P)/FAD-dependent oxidoreductase [Mesorhizobium sp. M1D.F.Ca.ET.231.01.1.1]TGP27501.1 NAD(P)/FAD-dependent oxidoreductase [Mesorhizobium sp. M1D.F.Ca.ET.234.01.1.1]TGS41536.1 NAD(P)/FAD-dependent oxidoreductase [Mesorhizobium sp. M1D.F.Ca.ET.184.01.1.1]TGS59297.1 NAD(P)/FAD-dependent oxidoreductase [Mesorhizobium sp. M1D.F.Ca.ET.183.01.1.1]